jgi:hypothetical protein
MIKFLPSCYSGIPIWRPQYDSQLITYRRHSKIMNLRRTETDNQSRMDNGRAEAALDAVGAM